MNWKQLRKLLNRPVKINPDFSNASLPQSDWFMGEIRRSRGYVVMSNPATGYRIPLSPKELVGYDEQVGEPPSLRLRVGLHFHCPNAFFVYRDGVIKDVQSTILHRGPSRG